MNHDIVTKDNSRITIACDVNLENLRPISNIKFKDLFGADQSSLLIFPESPGSFDSDPGEQYICSIHEQESADKECTANLRTYNLVGFVGRNSTRLSIHSRFGAGSRDFFLHYMLIRIAGLNLVDLPNSLDAESVLDFLPFLFPLYLKKALAQGIFRQYVTKSLNDINVRGRIDIARHLKENTPFNGKIAFTYRELSADNPVNQLIRHTIEYISGLPYGPYILSSAPALKDAALQIRQATPSWSARDREKIIAANLRPISHPLLLSYRPLQRLCLAILRHDEASYAPSENVIYGLLIDAAWLWEKYLAILLEDKFTHYTEDSDQRFTLFTTGQRIIPDFIRHIPNGSLIGDAKYIPLERSIDYWEEKATAIYYKTLAYMYCFRSQTGFLFYPLAEDAAAKTQEQLITRRYDPDSGLQETTMTITKLALRIPGSCATFQEFCQKMTCYELEFLKLCM